ncbi:MAG: DUF1189 family protein [archaeon]
MNFKEFFIVFYQALNPIGYRSLMSRKKREILTYFFMLLFFCVIIGAILSIPSLMSFPKKVEGALSKFSTFNITNVDIDLKEPLILMHSPLIVMDLSENRSYVSDETILITKTDVYIKKLDINFDKLSLFQTEKLPVRDFSDIKENFETVKNTYWLLFLFLLPSILFAIYVLNLTKYLFVIASAWVIVYIIQFIRGKKAKLSHHWRTAVLTSTVMVVLEVALSPIIKLGMLPIIIYFIYYIIAVSNLKNG